jgi:hypothetical protein
MGSSVHCILSYNIEMPNKRVFTMFTWHTDTVIGPLNNSKPGDTITGFNDLVLT